MAVRTLEECNRFVAQAINACASLPRQPMDVEVAARDGFHGTSFTDLGFDSLAFMEFCIAIHVDTGVELVVASVVEMGSPDAVARYLGEQA